MASRPHDFGSNDQSVVLEVDFTSAQNVIDAGGTVIGVPDFSADGMLARPAAMDGGALFDLSAFAPQLINGGQITIYAEPEVVAQADALDGINDSGSLGVNPAAIEFMFSTGTSGGSIMWTRALTDGSMHNFAGASGQTARYECVALSKMVKFTLSYDPVALEFTTWIDDYPRDPVAMLAPVADIFTIFTVGMSNLNTECLTIGRVKSITVSTDIPSVTVNGALSIAGDSYYAQGGFFPADNANVAINESKVGVIVQRYMVKTRNEIFNVPAVSPAIDSKFIDSSEANSLDSNKAAVIANNPTVVLVNCGVNDLEDRTQIQMEAYLRRDAEIFLSYLYDNGVEAVIWNEIISTYGNTVSSPPMDPDAFTKAAFINEVLRSMAAADPRLTIVPLHEIFGGDVFTPAVKSECFVRGMLNNFSTTSARNDIHPSTFGYDLMTSQVWPRLAVNYGADPAPLLNYSYPNESTTVGSTLALSLTDAWSGATGYLIDGNPVATEDMDGVITGYVAGSGTRSINVQASNDYATNTAGFLLEIKSGIPNK